ncbi:hypothetical protein EYC59_04760 [Candidatus Saccharibacteria bacterium]|nr:MAG: hypothetical protein EYC59_04760 [Candidatus Saccharibacteria bacterium]
MREYSKVDSAESAESQSKFTPPYYEFFGDSFVVHDPVWGECRIGEEAGDQVLLALLHNPLVRRMMAVEQLSLDKQTETVSGTAPFTRWEHMWGSVAFVRKMTENQGMDARDRLILQLRTFVSDLGHTAFSHIGDWIAQQMMTEDQHDLDLPQLLEQSGIIDLLGSFDIAKEEILTDTQDWIECDAPELCVDRVDYAARQLLRWFGDDETARRVLRPESFSVVDGRLVMNNEADARWFSKAFLLLSTEHFSEPFHRMQLKFQEEVVRYVMACPYVPLLSLYDGHRGVYAPRKQMYTIDGDIHYTADKFAYSRQLRTLMEAFGQQRRQRFAQQRQPAMRQYLQADTTDYPDPFTQEQHDTGTEVVSVGLGDATISLRPVDSAELGLAKDVPERGIYEFGLPILKPRFVDAPYKQPVTDEEVAQGVPFQVDPITGQAFRVCRVSEADANFRQLMAEQRRIFQRAYIGRLSVSEALSGVLSHGRAELAVEWPKALARPPMPKEVFQRMLGNSVSTAAVFIKIDLRWYD